MTQARIDPSYDNRNEMTGLSRYSDTAGTTLLGTSIFGFDDSGRQTAITHKNAAGASLSYYNYGYDSADRVTSQTWNSGTTNGSAAYTYDVTSQLLTDSVATYKYDLNGNRSMSGYSTGTDNRLTTDGTWNYTYDSEGNTTQKTAGSTTWTFTYDNLNHETSATEVVSGVTVVSETFTYDVFDHRVSQTVGGVTTRYAYAGQNVWATLDTSNTVLVRYIYGDQLDQPFARIITSGTGAGLSFYLTDHLGSVRDIMDASQALVDHIDYDGFGNVTLETAVAYGDWFQFASGKRDSSTGLYYFRARNYNPATGAWTSQDPLGLGPDSNRFRYAANDPTNEVDPSGLASVNVPAGAVILDKLAALQGRIGAAANTANTLFGKLAQWKDTLLGYFAKFKASVANVMNSILNLTITLSCAAEKTETRTGDEWHFTERQNVTASIPGVSSFAVKIGPFALGIGVSVETVGPTIVHRKKVDYAYTRLALTLIDRCAAKATFVLGDQGQVGFRQEGS